MIGAAVSPVAWMLVQRNSAVSRPSRPTAMVAVAARAIGPRATAASILPWSSPFRERAVFFIQKTIQVTKPTAMIDMNPPKASWASKVMVDEP